MKLSPFGSIQAPRAEPSCPRLDLPHLQQLLLLPEGLVHTDGVQGETSHGLLGLLQPRKELRVSLCVLGQQQLHMLQLPGAGSTLTPQVVGTLLQGLH